QAHCGAVPRRASAGSGGSVARQEVQLLSRGGSGCESRWGNVCGWADERSGGGGESGKPAGVARHPFVSGANSGRVGDKDGVVIVAGGGAEMFRPNGGLRSRQEMNQEI